MDNLIPFKYKQYGEYINSNRALPLDIDGLKPVERRILLSAYLVAKDKLTKCPRVEGTCTARFHPHSSPYGTIVQMVNQGFLIGQGNFGTNLGVEPSPPAASRYTECMMKPETVKLMFKLVKHVPWIESESRDDTEPQYLPTMFPVCIIGKTYTQGIAFGFRALVPCYDIQDLYKRLQWLLGIRKTKPIIKPISDCNIIATDKELDKLLTTGKASFKFQGVVKINKAKCVATVKSWPPGRRFESILNKKSVKGLLLRSDIGFIDSSNAARGTSIEFNVLKQKNRDKIFINCIKGIQDAVTWSVSFENTLTDVNKNTKLMSIDDMLLQTFEKYKEANQKMLQFEINKNKVLIEEYYNLEKIKLPLGKCLQKGVINKDNYKEKIQILSELSKLHVDIVKELITKYAIHKLFTVNTDTTDLQTKVDNFQNNLNNLHKYTLNDYKELLT